MIVRDGKRRIHVSLYHCMYVFAQFMMLLLYTGMLKLLRPLYTGINGLRISGECIKKTGVNDKSLTYGEVQPLSFLSILTSVLSNTDDKCGVFVDLGCGTGLAVMCAALSGFRFDKCWGIEIVPELAKAAMQCESRLQRCFAHARETFINSSSLIEEGTQKGKRKTERVSGDQCKQSVSKHRKGDRDSQEDVSDILLSLVLDALSKFPQQEDFNIEEVAALIVKRVGHKEYKKILKGRYKNFKKFLSSYPDRFTLVNENAFSCCSFADTHNVLYTNTDDSRTNDLVENGDENQAQNAKTNNEGTDFKVTAASVIDVLQRSKGEHHLKEELPAIKFDIGDIFERDWWSEADVAYCSSLLFSENMIRKLSALVRCMKPGSHFISLKPLSMDEGSIPHDKEKKKKKVDFVLISDSFYKMSWDMTRVYIYQIREVPS